jgi:UDP-4-amino-4,6-dideoxy-N-acetyl-beta-L-altrosamine N-acetyltransferase
MGEAPRVELRPVRAADRERLRGWRNQPDIRRWMYTDHEISEAEHARWFEAVIGEPRPRHWIIEADAAPIGLVNLYDLQPAHRRAAWAYYIAEPSVRGKGVGACVEYLTLERAFGEFGLNRLTCEVLADNEAVIALHESVGFRREALFRQHDIKAGQPADVVGLALLAEDWSAQRDACRERLSARGYAL